MRSSFVALGGTICALGCGGGSVPPAADPVATAPDSSAKSAPVRPAARRATVPKAVGSCDDGSCFHCGDAVCFSGYFCEVSTSAHGCGWVPACATKPTCACLAATLHDAKCTCEEKQSGVYLSCDGASL